MHLPRSFGTCSENGCVFAEYHVHTIGFTDRYGQML